MSHSKVILLEITKKKEITFEINLLLLCMEIKEDYAFYLNVLKGYLYSNSVNNCCKVQKM